MDNSISNTNGVTKDYTSDKVTIKVKVAGEDYHDLVIDWSERSGRFKGQQIINQLSSIIGIPSNFIRRVDIAIEYERPFYFIKNIEQKDFNIESYGNEEMEIRFGFSKQNCEERFHNGDCFAIKTELCPSDFQFRITLYSPVSFTDNDCTPRYCHYSNTRAFINRQIAIATNAELLVQIRSECKKLPPFGHPDDQEARMQWIRLEQNIFGDFNIKPLLYWSWCHVIEDDYRSNMARVCNINPLYSRTRG